MSKRKYAGDEKRKGEGGNGRRWTSQNKGQLSGPGILLTSVRRKEKKAALELIAFLNDIADALYPNLDLSRPVETPSQVAHRDSDDEFDSMRNGPATQDATAEITSQSEAKRKRIDEDDIEAQIQAELEELRPQKKKKELSLTSAERVMKVKSRERFEVIDLDVECLSFVSIASPMDPVKMCCEILDEVAKTGQVRGRFVQRLSPIYMTGRADIGAIRQLSAEVITKYYPNASQTSTYKVEPRIRLHNTLNKMDVIQTVAASIPAPHRADLIKPDYIISVEIFKSNVGIGILPRYEQYKRFNPQMIAQEYSETYVETKEETSRVLQGS